jgi:hypothetical protein
MTTAAAVVVPATVFQKSARETTAAAVFWKEK